MPKLTFVLFIAASACFLIYGYYQVEFFLQPSWISAEAFRLQDIYFEWMGAAFVMWWVGVLWWRLFI